MLGGIIMSKWDGRYSTSREGSQSLEDDILDAGRGKFTYETSTGGTVRETDTRIDVYGPSDSSKGHSHDWYNGDTNEHGHHD
jgi:hypothetical protein